MQKLFLNRLANCQKSILPHFRSLSSAFSDSRSEKLGSIGGAISQKSGLGLQSYDYSESDYTETPEYPPEVASLYNTTTEDHVKQRRKILTDIIKSLPTVEEKIEFVNPYERPWRPTEKHRHRPYMRPLSQPRKSYLLSPIPSGYNSLGLYKHVTNTHCIEGLPDNYAKIDVTAEQIQVFKERVFELLKNELKGRQDFPKSIDSFIEQVANCTINLFSADFPHLQDFQVGTNVRYESFIERSGFKHLYKDYTAKKARLTGDTIHRLGELSFCFKDIAQVQLRSELSLEPIVNRDDKICMNEVPKFEYHPIDVNTMIERDILWMVPGYEYGDNLEFGHLMINNLKNLDYRLALWEAEPEERKECLLSQAMGSLFSWLNGQAHYKGFTQLTDMTYPLVSQGIFTNGKSWFFACYQLNTLDLLYDFDGHVTGLKKPPYANLCWYEGPLDLYQSIDQKTGEFLGVNDHVIKLLLKFMYNRPVIRKDVEDFKPYVAPVVKIEDTDHDVIEKHIKETAGVKYTV